MLRRYLKIALSLVPAAIVLISTNAIAQGQADSKVTAQPAVVADKPQAADSSAKAAVEDQDVAQTSKAEKESKGKTHFRLGGIGIGAGYTHFSDNYYVRPFWPYPYGFGYSPFFYDSFYYPSYDPVFYRPYLSSFAPYPYPYELAYEAGKGEVKLEAEPKTAEVRLDGAYAGTAEKLKSMWLAPGAYDLTVSSANGGERVFHERIYVLSGKTVKIKARLVAQNAERKALDKKPDNEGEKR
jgi:hypothetical protein